MKFVGLYLALLVPAFPIAFGQVDANAQLATITVSLPADLSAEGGQINYFMTGAFGGYGKFVRTSKGMTSYEIAASVDGKPAASVKIVSYFPGCAIETLELKAPFDPQPKSLTCNPIRQTTLRGQIPADAIPQNKAVQVNVEYLGLWTHDFFGIGDGIVMTLHMAKAIPAKDGSFEIEVPDFSSQSKLGDAAFELTLLDAKTGNVLASLKTGDETGNAYGLEVRPDYPQVIQFTAEKH